MTEKLSPITNCWGTAETVVLSAVHFQVYRAGEGGSYSHHAQITSQGERLYATWSLGDLNEDDVGQRMVMAISDDLGRTWSPPQVVAPPGTTAAVVTNGGIVPMGQRLMACFGQYEYDSWHLKDGHRLPADMAHKNVFTAARVSDDGGATWSAPKTILRNIIPNLGPLPIGGGRRILPGCMAYGYSDDPAGLGHWEISRLPRLDDSHVDDSEGWQKGQRARGDERGFCEGSFFQTDDGIIHMMLRTGANRLAVTESRNDGETWSEPVMTEYTDNVSKHHFGRLPDGRFFGLSTPDPVRLWQRTPLVLAISEDGVRFDRHFIVGDEPNAPPRMPGMHKGGRYGYPYLHVMGEWCFAIYSVAKEDIAICRFALSELE